MRVRLAACAVALFLGVPSVAVADPGGAPPGGAAAGPTGSSGGTAAGGSAGSSGGAAAHRGVRYKLGVYAYAGLGYRAIVPYNGEYCGQLDSGSNAKICEGRTPLRIDVGASYGITRSIEIMVDADLGIESDIGAAPGQSGPHIVGLAPGFNFHTANPFGGKLFSSLQLAIDFSNYTQASGTDLGVRNVNRLEIPISTTASAFGFFSETVGGNRWLRFEVNAGIGVAARFF